MAVRGTIGIEKCVIGKTYLEGEEEDEAEVTQSAEASRASSLQLSIDHTIHKKKRRGQPAGQCSLHPC